MYRNTHTTIMEHIRHSASYSFRKRLISRVGRLAKFHQRWLIWHGFWRKVGLNDAVSTVSASSEQFGTRMKEQRTFLIAINVFNFYFHVLYNEVCQVRTGMYIHAYFVTCHK